MGSLERRLARLEAQARASSEAAEAAEEREKQDWLARARICRNETMPKAVRRARDLIRLFRTQNILFEMSTEELVQRIVRWHPEPQKGWPKNTVEREVALAIYNQQQGTENMICPAAWRESFVAGDELKAKYAAAPDEALVEALAAGEREAFEPFGITEELERRAIGPDACEITEEESLFRIGEYAADLIYGERGYKMAKLMQERKGARWG